MNDLREYRMTTAAHPLSVVVGIALCALLMNASIASAQSLRSGVLEHNYQHTIDPWLPSNAELVEPEWAASDEPSGESSELSQPKSVSIQPLSFGGETGLYRNSETPIVETIYRHQPVDQDQPIPSPQTISQRKYFSEQQAAYTQPSAPQWSLLPDELLFRSFLGGPREPRFASQILHSSRYGTIWELEAGGRVGILRYGSPEGTKPEGWQLDVEGAAFPRLNFDESLELDAVDFKVGVPLTWAEGPYQFEVAIYHLSSHVGDEYLLRPGNEGFRRLDYLRDAITMGFGYFVNPDFRVYSEIEWAFRTNDGAEPWHFQFGFDYMPANPRNPFKPVPFFAVNGQLREEVNFGGGINVVGGIAWKGPNSGRIFRAGIQYYNGESFQLSFFDEHEQLIGAGIWYDF